MVEQSRLDDRAVAQRLARFDELVAQLELLPGPGARTALDAVAVLAEIYGEALARVMVQASRDAAVVQGITGDQLLRHLLVLHEVHPDPVEQRVGRALTDVRPYLQSHGGDVELVDIDHGVARVRLSGSCGGCASSSQTLEHAVEDAVLAAAPELSGVEQDRGAGRSVAAFIPTQDLLRRPATATRGTT